MAAEVNISAYSGSVSAGDWGPAFEAAWAALPQGGTINVDTDVTIKSTVDFIPTTPAYTNLKVKGNLGNWIKTDLAGVCFHPGNVNKAIFEDLVFIGSSPSTNVADSYQVIGGSGDRVIVNRCEFYGVYAYDAIIYCANADIEVTACRFGGCAGANGHIFVQGASLTVYGCEMYDYANWNGDYWDRQGVRNQWIRAEMLSSYPITENPIGASATFVDIQRVRLDEGALNGIDIRYYPHVNVSRSRINFNGASSATAVTLLGVGHAKIDQLWGGYGNNNQASVSASGCGIVEIDGVRTHNGSHPVALGADSTRIDITASPNATVTGTSPYQLNGVKYKGTVKQVG